jgi:hypothetical protein
MECHSPLSLGRFNTVKMLILPTGDYNPNKEIEKSDPYIPIILQ